MGIFTGGDENDLLHGTSEIDLIKGGGGHDQLYGSAGNDTLYGMNGDDTLAGGVGADDMYGGKGNDNYYVDSLLDKVVEAELEGAMDGVFTSITLTLPPNVEILHMWNSGGAINGFGNLLNNTFYANDSNNILMGGAGNDGFIGGGGNDTMYGGFDDDSYHVQELGDVVIEYAGQGEDTIYAHVPYDLPAHVENLELEDEAGQCNVLGNDEDNRIEGNFYDNILKGGNGDDDLRGWGGNDTLEGGAGADVLIGDYGNWSDTISYASSDAGVLVNLGNGDAYGGHATGDYLLVETLDNVVGSAHVDFLYGSGLANLLDGGGGGDTLWGGLNTDTFRFAGSFGQDTVHDFAIGEDKLQFDDAQFANFAAVQAAMSQAGADAVITFNAGNTITLLNINAASLSAGDVLFI